MATADPNDPGGIDLLCRELRSAIATELPAVAASATAIRIDRPSRILLDFGLPIRVTRIALWAGHMMPNEFEFGTPDPAPQP